MGHESFNGGAVKAPGTEVVPDVEKQWEAAVPPGWKGRPKDLGDDALGMLRGLAVAFARREVGRYSRWSAQEDPAMPGGYSVEGVAHKAMALLLQSKAGGVHELYSAEAIRAEVERVIKHQVWRLHERRENFRSVSEWVVLPRDEEGEWVSIFDTIAGGLAPPDVALLDKEQRELVGELRSGFEASLGNRQDLRRVFEGFCEGEKRREMAASLGLRGERVKQLLAQVQRRLKEAGSRAPAAVVELAKG